MKLLRHTVLVALSVLCCMSCNKDDEDDNKVVVRPSLRIYAIFNDLDTIEGVTIELYESIKDWNQYKDPAFTAITDSSGSIDIMTDTLLAYGLTDLTDYYIFAHKASIMSSNWTSLISLLFDKTAKDTFSIDLSKDNLYKVLSVSKWNLVDIRLSGGVSIMDDDCLSDNYLEIKRAYDSNNINIQYFILHEGVNVCVDKDTQDTLVNNPEYAISDGAVAFMNSDSATIEEYGNYLNASLRDGNMITFSGQMIDSSAIDVTYQVYMDYVAE